MKNFMKALLMGLLLSCAVFNAHSHCLDVPRLTGVNVAGAEFNAKNLPGVIYKNYTYPADAELRYIAQQGANVIRLPFRWERIQHELRGDLDPAELGRMRKTVASAKANGLCVILDIHNYAQHYGTSLAGNQALQDGFVDVWLRLAAAFDESQDTAFDLMNEPAHMPLPEWAALAKRTLAALREAKAANMVFIEGGSWSGLHDWFKPHDGLSNAAAFADLTDPLNRVIVEVHQYADEWYSGTGTDCHPPEHFDPLFARISAWAKEHKQKLFLGEFGVPASPPCLKTLEHMLELAQGEPWLGWTYWAAGGWWGNYPMALNTNSEQPSRQWRPLRRHFYGNNPPLPPEPDNP